MSPKWRRRLALTVVAVTLVAWPASCLTVAKGEPQFVLGLSWLAITLTAADIAATTDVRKQQDGNGGAE